MADTQRQRKLNRKVEETLSGVDQTHFRMQLEKSIYS